MKNRLRELRAAKGWTQDELGKRVKVSRQAINALETGKHDPSLDLAFRLAVEFGLPVEQVFENPYPEA
ncbi:helix-turn-helix transcriptional regulator [Luteolibacter ambystomatis]|uniref:Helix-turn-helix transcriptional regulator n=1 Tax=Luteolibacter ambystomatis TaxID=2824561 RepID=A0A975G965_9BACT|nr:helix-turn-helix transcriptional regulator [Luteolibacter ambystomatis]QUE51096.1 helix-turn-helix transcriptional regulator [Luteolibacter ambystomatis]